jgi:hypothetical protein
MVDNEVISVPFRAICINNAMKPKDVDDNEWIEDNNEYIVTEIYRDLDSGDIAYKLLDKDPKPYKGYRSDRFYRLTVFSVN